MDFSTWGGPRDRKTLVILGAGASFGARLPRWPKFGPRPPLDVGFFSELQKLNGVEAASQLLSFVRKNFGSSSRLSMEEFFSQVDYMDRFHRSFRVDRGRKVVRFEHALDDFYRVLPQLFAEAIGARDCPLHNYLASRLGVKDGVISFNYDCLMDLALREHAGRKWDPAKRGYGFSVRKGAEHWKSHSRGKGVYKSSIRLLKPHGSMNWSVGSGGEVSLTPTPYKVSTAKKRIVPPTWFKDVLQAEPFRSVWRSARLELRACKALVVIGYSVPQTDLFSRALFKAELGSKGKRERLDYLVLVNPDAEARSRFADLVQGGLENATKIIEFRDLEEFIENLRGSSDPDSRVSASRQAPPEASGRLISGRGSATAATQASGTGSLVHAGTVSGSTPKAPRGRPD